MSRETTDLYRWMWREARARHDGRLGRAAVDFLWNVGMDMVRAVALSAARMGSLARRRVEATSGAAILAGGGRLVGAAGFCLLLFAPMAFALVASQSPSRTVSPGGEIVVFGAGMVTLDGVPTRLEDLGAELASQGTRVVSVSLSANTPVRVLTELRSEFDDTAVERVWMHAVSSPTGDAR